jgi:hypothetical protein
MKCFGDFPSSIHFLRRAAAKFMWSMPARTLRAQDRVSLIASRFWLEFYIQKNFPNSLRAGLTTCALSA